MAGYAPVCIVETLARLEWSLPRDSSPRTVLRLLRLGYVGKSAPGGWHVCTVVQDEDLQGAIAVTPEFRDLQRCMPKSCGPISPRRIGSRRHCRRISMKSTRVECQKTQSHHAKAYKTNHIECFNNTCCQRVSRLVREPLAFSKTIANHYSAIRFFIDHYNLTRAAALSV